MGFRVVKVFAPKIRTFVGPVANKVVRISLPDMLSDRLFACGGCGRTYFRKVGAGQESPGQRPGSTLRTYINFINSPALKGRHSEKVLALLRLEACVAP